MLDLFQQLYLLWVQCTTIPVRITMLEITWTDFDRKYVQNCMITTAAQAFKVFFTNTINVKESFKSTWKVQS